MTYWSGRRVLVTGAGGFIGSHVAERLVELGARVRAFVHYNALSRAGWLEESPVRKDLEIVAGDLCDRDRVRRAVEGSEIVFHLGALIAIPYSYHAPLSYVRTNVEGTVNVLQAAREAGVERVVHTSTSEVYGAARYVPIDEDHPLQSRSPYAATKIAADQMALAFHRSFGLPVVIVRPFNTYGPRQSARAVVPTIILQCLACDRVRLGNVHPTRDLNYVTDTAEGFVLAGQSDRAIGNTVQLGSGREISVRELVDMVAAFLGKSVVVETDVKRRRPDDGEVERLIANASRAREILGWQPTVSLEEGLQRTIEWIRAHAQTYPSDEYVV